VFSLRPACRACEVDGSHRDVDQAARSAFIAIEGAAYEGATPSPSRSHL
jgi:hypothetical protein